MKARMRQRGEVWYLDQMLEKVRYRERIGAGSRAWAQPIANERLAELVRGGKSKAAGKCAVKVADLEEPWRKFSRGQKHTLAHQNGSWNALVRIVERGLDQKVEAARLSDLDPAMVERYRELKLEDADDEVEQDRKERSAYSEWRQARSLLQPRAVDYYRRQLKIRVPDSLVDLRVFQLPRPPAFRYVLPPRELIEATEAAAKDLEGGMSMIYRLAMNAGLRASEMVHMRGNWVERSGDAWVIAVITRKDYRPKGTERRVPVPESLAADCQAAGKDFVLGGPHESFRRNLIRYDFSQWMRGIGWERAEYGKSAHELRKLYGSRIFSSPELGPQYAQAYLGHASIETTCRYYAALDASLKWLPER